MAKKKAKTDESEEGGSPPEEGEGNASAGGKKKLIMIGAAVAVLLGASAGGYFFFMKPKGDEHAEMKAEKAKPVSFVDLPEMTINLSTAQTERQQYFKVKIALEVGDPKIAEEIKPVMPRVLDTFQIYLREMRTNDLEGSAAMYRLKEELMRRVNVAIYPAKIDAVLFKEALVQ